MMTRIHRLFVLSALTATLVLSASFVGFSASAAELAGVTLPDTLQVGGTPLVLNGMGIREATIFKVKVYVAGLYVPVTSQNAEEILASSQTKSLTMHFVHEVGAGKLRDAWKEGIEKNCKSSCDAAKPAVEKLNTAMTDMKPGDRMSIVFHPAKVEVAVKDAAPVSIDGAEFGRALLAIWLGTEPPNKSLKEGLLGKLKK
jgi:Chalcone isomerase-like